MVRYSAQVMCWLCQETCTKTHEKILHLPNRIRELGVQEASPFRYSASFFLSSLTFFPYDSQEERIFAIHRKCDRCDFRKPCIRSCIHAYVHAYMHHYMHTYMHTCVHNIHTFIYLCFWST